MTAHSSADAEDVAAPPSPLPRGRHGLSRDLVRRSQRDRLVREMLACVEAKGYGATTILELTKAARVSPNAFYEIFGDKKSCFLDACDVRAKALIRDLQRLADEPAWTTAVRKGVRIYLAHWVEHPGFATAYNVELPAAGRFALRHRDETHAQFIAMYEALAERARIEEPRLPPLPRLATEVLTTGTTELVGRLVRDGRIDALPALEDDLVYLIIATLSDDELAADERAGSACR